MQFSNLRQQVVEKTLTSAEKKKREEVAKAIERDNPSMPMGMKMAIATKTAKRVAEDAAQDYIAAGGKVTKLPYKQPRKSEKTNYGSKHIGGPGDRMKTSRTGTAANTQSSKVVGEEELTGNDQETISELSKQTVANYTDKVVDPVYGIPKGGTKTLKRRLAGLTRAHARLVGKKPTSEEVELDEGKDLPVVKHTSPYEGAEVGEYTEIFSGSPKSAQTFAKHVISKGGQARLGSRGYHTYVYHKGAGPVSKADVRKANSSVKEGTELDESMPASVIRHKQHLGQMPDKEFAELHKDSSVEKLTRMARSHGFKNNPNHYIRKRERGQEMAEEVTHSEVEEAYTKVKAPSKFSNKLQNRVPNPHPGPSQPWTKDEQEKRNQGLESLVAKMRLKNDERMKNEDVDEASYQGKGNHRPGWMLRADPKLAQSFKEKINLAKKRQKAYGDPSAGKSVKEEADNIQELTRFKMRELDAEHRSEQEAQRNKEQRRREPHHVYINGKVWKKEGKPVEFANHRHASSAAISIQKKDPEKYITVAHHTVSSKHDGVDKTYTPGKKSHWVTESETPQDMHQVDELSNALLGAYKAAAGAAARAADKVGKYRVADKRFSGILKATNKQFANDAKVRQQNK